jgi:hypothetical protein
MMNDVAVLEKVSLAAKRLSTALETQKLAVAHLSLAIAETEASRADLHEVGKQCWIDKLDHEHPHG